MISRFEDCSVDLGAIWTDCKCAWIFGGDRNRGASCSWIEWIDDTNLIQLRERDKCALRTSSKCDVAWFIADSDGANDTKRGQVDDADRIADEVGNPRLSIRSCSNRDWIKSDRNGSKQNGNSTAGRNIKDFKSIVCCIDRKQSIARRCDLEWVDLWRFPIHKVGLS